MDILHVKTAKETIPIDKQVFLELLDFPFIKGYVDYDAAIKSNEINLSDLKKLSDRVSVPYPLFFAPLSKVRFQIRDKDKYLSTKLPTKAQIRLSSRGSAEFGDIELIARDLARKQEFLKNRILTEEPDNTFIGIASKALKLGASNTQIAELISKGLKLDLKVIRSMSKTKVLEYVSGQAENQGVLVSFSSHDFMPQNLRKEIELSGICIKDKKFPYIFLNTRDGDEEPLILESEGRQIFTLLCMLTYVALDKFVMSLNDRKQGNDLSRRIFAIAGEILLPTPDLKDVKVTNLEELRAFGNKFKVTPSMLLVRLRKLNLIRKPLADSLRQELLDAIKNKKTGRGGGVVPEVTGFGKYNGKRFSKEVVGAHSKGRVARDDASVALFKRTRMSSKLFAEYTATFT